MGISPNGRNINADCGSTYPKIAAETVIAHNADVGLCLDGDADRLIIIDENGKVANGDQLMALLAQRWFREGRLNGHALVTTVMSNLGLERYLNDQGIALVRTKVGDRYVVERMREGGFNLGGEQSGHIVMSDYSTTGDGLMAGLQFLAEIIRTGQQASQLLGVFEMVPQLLKNVRYTTGQYPLEMPSVKQAISNAEGTLFGQGRLLIRKSGTEPLIRIMAECESDNLLHKVVDDVVQSVIKACAS
jgi:phosphoglucosamine mutase